jgi:hypothetical protein
LKVKFAPGFARSKNRTKLLLLEESFLGQEEGFGAGVADSKQINNQSL